MRKGKTIGLTYRDVRPDFEERSHLDGNPASDDGFASPGRCFVHIGALEDPEAADEFLGFEVGAVGDGDVAVGLLAQRFGVACGFQTACEGPGARGIHLFVESCVLLRRNSPSGKFDFYPGYVAAASAAICALSATKM
jgi:hypothetical protein